MHVRREKKPSAAQQAYWDSKLRGFKLTEDAGRKEWLSYGHRVTDLDWDGRRTFKKETGERLENEEWPISLC